MLFVLFFICALMSRDLCKEQRILTGKEIKQRDMKAALVPSISMTCNYVWAGVRLKVSLMTPSFSKAAYFTNGGRRRPVADSQTPPI